MIVHTHYGGRAFVNGWAASGGTDGAARWSQEFAAEVVERLEAQLASAE